MSSLIAPADDVVERLTALALDLSGFARGAVRADAISRTLRSLLARGSSEAEVAGLIERADPTLIASLMEAISVGETFFFRHPEHFELIARELSGAADPVRAWSAGCATGEETYSLAACLLGSGVASCEVIGTDLVDTQIETASRAVYRPWSMRESGPMLWPVVRADGEGMLRVLPHVQAHTRFLVHNLLDAPSFGPFRLIVCRNVLIYLTERAASLVCSHLANALVPGGLIVFGTMDLVIAPPTLERLPPHEMQVYRRVESRRPRSLLPTPKRASTVPPLPRLTPEIVRAPVSNATKRPVSREVAQHVEALHEVESGNIEAAERRLQRLGLEHPTYLPGVLERALLASRRGQNTLAVRLMREVSAAANALTPTTIIIGPMPLPASFYAQTAETFLATAHRRGR
jgi:chemotaxis protein methyltransferase CheR